MLQDMFKDKPDMLAAYDSGGSGGGSGGRGRGGRGGRGGSGGGDDSGSFDWRGSVRGFVSGLGSSVKGLASALGAVLGFFLILGIGASARCSHALVHGGARSSPIRT